MEDSFAVGGLGAMDSWGGGYSELIYLLNYPQKALPIFHTWLSSPLLSRQLYGLLGIHTLDKAAFRRLAPRYALSNAPLKVWYGCDRLTETVGDIAWKIGTNDYKSRLQGDHQRFHDSGSFIELTEQTRCFSVGRIGIASCETRLYRAFRADFLSPNPVERFTAQSTDSDWLVRCYALQGLRLRDREAFRKALRRATNEANDEANQSVRLPVAVGYSVAKLPLIVLLNQLEYAGWDYPTYKGLGAAARENSLTKEQQLAWREWILERSEQQKRDFKAGQYFAIGGIGFSGSFPERYQTFLVTLKRPDASQVFVRLLEYPNEVTRLYAWLGLRLSDKKTYARSSIAVSDEILLRFNGCVVGQTTGALVRDEIDSGKHDKKVLYDLRHPHL